MEEWLKTASLVFALVATGVSFIIAVLNYRQLVKQKKFELYESYRKKLRESEDFREILSLIEKDDIKLRKQSFLKRYQFLGFYEDISIMIKSGLMNPYIAHYMFSYYALSCWKSKNFWCEINRESLYWEEFRKFVFEMKLIEINRRLSGNNYHKRMKL